MNPTNAQSSGFNAANFGSGIIGYVSGIPVICSPGLATVTNHYGLVVNSAAVEVYEQRVGALQATEPSVLGVQVAYAGYFTAFPDLAPEDDGFAYGDGVLVTWGHLRGTSGGEWLGVPPSGGSFAVPFTNVTTFAGGRMAGETISFDLATLCEQAALPLDAIRAAAAARRAA